MGIIHESCSLRESLCLVVPANAGTDSHRRSLLQKVSRSIFLIETSRGMGPGSRPGRREIILRSHPRPPEARFALLDPVKNGERESAHSSDLANARKAL